MEGQPQHGFSRGWTEQERKDAVEAQRARAAGIAAVAATPNTRTTTPLRVVSPVVGDEGVVGRPPVPWRVPGVDVVDALNHGMSVEDAAAMAGVSVRTIPRVLRRCGYVRGRSARAAQFEQWLPNEQVHALDELVDFRAHLRAGNGALGPEQFARLCGVDAPTMVRRSREAPPLWTSLDDVERQMARGVDPTQLFDTLPGEQGSPWRTDPDRPDTKTTRSPRRAAIRAAGTDLGGRRPEVTGVDQLKAVLIAEYTRGETIEFLARKFEVSRSTLQRRLKLWGAEMRDPGRRDTGAMTGTELRFPDDDS
jgi:transposase